MKFLYWLVAFPLLSAAFFIVINNPDLIHIKLWPSRSGFLIALPLYSLAIFIAGFLLGMFFMRLSLCRSSRK